MQKDLKKKFVIAEIGNNHEGNFSLAKKMIKEASKAGVDAVKFQAFNTNNFFVSNKNQFNKYKKFEFSLNQFKKLSIYAKKNKIIFFSTPLDPNIVNNLNKFQSMFKIASGDNNFFLLVEKILKLQKPLIISTGLLDTKGVSKLVNFVRKIKKKNKLKNKVILLHCVSDYPAKMQNLNLNSIKYLSEKYKDFIIGYSDHSKGIEACKIALLLGANVIEKHFTLDKNQSDFRDHKFSATPKEMKRLILYKNDLEKILGQKKILISQNEKKNIKFMRRSIYASRNIMVNEKITLKNTKFVRPGFGITPNKFNLINGKKVKRHIYKNNPIKLNDVK